MRRALLLVFGLLLVCGLGAQDLDFSKVEMKVSKVAGNVYLLQGACGNIAASVGNDGVVLIDDESAPLADKVQAALRGITNKPVRFVINNKNRAIGVSSTTFKVATQDTAGALFVMEQSNTMPGGPPRHLHHDQDEFWYVLAGEYVVEVGSDRYRAQPGDCILGPRNIAHSWAFVGESPGRLLIAFTPAGRMQEWFERDRKKGEYMNDAALYHAFGLELVGPPLSLK